MNILLTGGLGFIGSNFAKYLIEKYWFDNLVIIDIFNSSGRKENLNKFNESNKVKFLECDIFNRTKLEEIFSQFSFDLVVNFAAETSVDYSFKNEEIFYNSNYIGTKNLIDLSIKYKVNHFHQFSTDEVYGPYFEKDSIGFMIDSKLNPQNPYAKSKAMADEYCLLKKDKLKHLTISRCSNVFGLQQTVDKLIPNFSLKIIKDESLILYGDGSYYREWINVNDVTETLFKIINSRSDKTIFHIANSVETNISNNEIKDLAIKEAKKIGKLINYKNVNGRKVNDFKYLLYLDEIDKGLNISKNKETILNEISSVFLTLISNKKYHKILLEEEQKFIQNNRINLF